jgi:PAS domain S-box-containing protein
MHSKILDLIDIEKVNTLLEGFNQSTGYVTAILDLEGNVISKSGWRNMCTAFHRIHPETSQRCKLSDTVLAGKMADGEKYHAYKCLNGLVDVAVPLVINGEHVANLFSGQFFLEEPDIDYFRDQAIRYGFDEKEYLDALGLIPVMAEDSVHKAMDFLLNMTRLISEMAYQKLELTELNNRIYESEQKYRLLFESNPHPMWVYDISNLNFLEVNEAAVRKYGYTRNEFLQMALKDIHPAEDIDRLLDDVKHTTDEYTFSSEWRHINKIGEVFPVEIISHPINFLSKKARIELANDITTRKQLNAELELKVEQRTAQLEASNKELEAFSYSVSHDLRAPLRHINGYVELLKEKYHDTLPEKAQHYMDNVVSASGQMGKLIDNLLQFSRTSRKEVQMHHFDMNILVHEVLETLRPDFEKRMISWKIHDLPEVKGDYALLKQVWINLVDNALKYTQRQNPAQITIGYTEDKDTYVFYIRDNGVGFDMKYAHKLFGVFQRLHSLIEFEGTGIGLAHVQRIVHKHNGKVWAEAETDRGATFFFDLPNNQ